MPTPTPLTAAGFSPELCDKLAPYWISSLEDFVDLARSQPAKHTSGVEALALALDLPPARIEELFRSAQAALPPESSYDVLPELNIALGVLLDEDDDLPDDVAYDLPVRDLPPEQNLANSLPPVRSQGDRNTCVAFTIAAMVQQQLGLSEELSPQFVYWAARRGDQTPGDTGLHPDTAMQAIQKLGICREGAWSYVPEKNDTNPTYGPPPEPARSEAPLIRASAFTKLPKSNLNAIKSELADGRSVMLVMPIFDQWLQTRQTRIHGRVGVPLPNSDNLGPHAMLAVGYRDDPAAPGGGYLIVRNSWGTEYAKENPDGAGHLRISYQTVYSSNRGALTFTGFAAQPVRANTPAPAVQATPKAEPQPDMPPVPAPALQATLHSAEPQPEAAARPAEDQRALYEEALALAATLQQGLDRLTGLLRRLAPPGDPATTAQPAPAQAEDAPVEKEPPAPGLAFSAPPDSDALRRRGVSGPLVLVRSSEPPPDDLLAPNGIMATTGDPLLVIDAGTASGIAREGAQPKEHPERVLHEGRVQADASHYGMIMRDENNMRRAGWAVVVNALEDAAVLRALTPLIQKRCADQGLPLPQLEFRDGETCQQWLQRSAANPLAPLKSGIPVLLYGPGETAVQFLNRYGVAMEPVDPRRGVPFYLMLVGRPGPLRAGDQAFIPFSVQYEIDLFWGVGRLCFTAPQSGMHDLAAYSAYAEQVVAYEQRKQPPTSRHIVYFGTQNNLDRSTELSTNGLIKPLFNGTAERESIAALMDFSQELFVAKQATRATLDQILRGDTAAGRPSLLFSASHGLGYPADSRDLATYQGALICQDWPGSGTVKREHFYAAEDLSSQTRVDGLIAFLFACFGAGSPQEDQFVFKQGQEPAIIAPYPLIAQLPQQLLARGALAVLGHVDRAWSYSFSQGNMPSQTQRFESVIGQLMRGDRLGLATDQFNSVQGALAVRLAELQGQSKWGADERLLSTLWAARNDARNYIVLGDPAVRLGFTTPEV
ncbi:MAG TPA: C1 family peptidase [Roseiflexaceae bacterium]|nr:C1 family peptidase [Roseiflexaceae bacterium]